MQTFKTDELQNEDIDFSFSELSQETLSAHDYLSQVHAAQRALLVDLQHSSKTTNTATKAELRELQSLARAASDKVSMHAAALENVLYRDLGASLDGFYFDLGLMHTVFVGVGAYGHALDLSMRSCPPGRDTHTSIFWKAFLVELHWLLHLMEHNCHELMSDAVRGLGHICACFAVHVSMVSAQKAVLRSRIETIANINAHMCSPYM